jgi:hypothetical protein
VSVLVGRVAMCQPASKEESTMKGLVVQRGQGKWELIGKGHMRDGKDALYKVGTREECLQEAHDRYGDGVSVEVVDARLS